MLEKVKQESWLKPDSGYIGPNPEGRYLVYTWWEGHPPYSRANLDMVKERLTRAAELNALPYEKTDNGPWILTVGGRFGRHEHIFVGPDAPQAVKEEAENILRELDDYPILDENLADEYALEKAQEVWKWLDVRERVEVIRRSNATSWECISIFAARRDELPAGVDIHELVS